MGSCEIAECSGATSFTNYDAIWMGYDRAENCDNQNVVSAPVNDDLFDAPEVGVKKIDCECYTKKTYPVNFNSEISMFTPNSAITHSKDPDDLIHVNQFSDYRDSGMIRNISGTSHEKVINFKRTIAHLREEYKERLLPGVLNLIFDN